MSCLSNLLFVRNAITGFGLAVPYSLSKTLEHQLETDIFALFTLSDFYSSIKVNGPIKIIIEHFVIVLTDIETCPLTHLLLV